MSAMDTASDRIKNFILANFPLARKRGIQENDPLLEGGILDSLGVLDLVGFVEREFAVQVSDDELIPENFQSIGHVVRFVDQKRSAGPAAAVQCSFGADRKL
jgi:acyl carrier protein